jgi:hypothetical protein
MLQSILMCRKDVELLRSTLRLEYVELDGADYVEVRR